jgi:hypothetical protein
MEIEIEIEKVRVKSTSKLSNRQWHAEGKPKWWAKVKETKDDNGEFLRIGFNRGDEPLDVTISLNDIRGKYLQIGVGKHPDGIREMKYIPPDKEQE